MKFSAANSNSLQNFSYYANENILACISLFKVVYGYLKRTGQTGNGPSTSKNSRSLQNE